jgi:hypothetical protein
VEVGDVSTKYEVGGREDSVLFVKAADPPPEIQLLPAEVEVSPVEGEITTRVAFELPEIVELPEPLELPDPALVPSPAPGAAEGSFGVVLGSVGAVASEGAVVVLEGLVGVVPSPVSMRLPMLVPVVVEAALVDCPRRSNRNFMLNARCRSVLRPGHCKGVLPAS